MPALIDLTGKVFHRLTVLARVGGNPIKYRCLCDCGVTKEVMGKLLKNGKAKSCGCLKSESAKLKATKHGEYGTPEYVAWISMWGRCTNQNNHKFQEYKDRAPPDEWRDFEVFLACVGKKPSPSHSLDRIDNNKPYGPGNVRWATRIEQQNNTSANRLVTLNGNTKTITQWCVEHSLLYVTVKMRLRRGWSLEKALTAPVVDGLTSWH